MAVTPNRIALPIAVVTLWTATALSQTRHAPEADQREAARLFEAATTHADRGETAEALDLFRRSLELYPTAATAFNLALTLHDTGRVVEAIELIEALTEGRYGDLPPDRLEQAAAQRRAYGAEVATLRIRVTGATSADVRVDGSRSGEATEERPLDVRVDPGPHVVTAQAGSVTRETRVDVRRGERKPVALAFRIPAPAADEVGLDREPALSQMEDLEDESAPTVFEEPWFWVIAGLVAVGAGVGAAFALQGGGDESQEPIFGSHEVLRVAAP